MESRLFRIKRWRTRVSIFLPLFLMFLSLGLIVFGQFENPYLKQFKIALKETVAPVVRVVSYPVWLSKSLFNKSVDFIYTYQENSRLKMENEELKTWRNLALQLKIEQKSLQELLKYTPPPESTYITARVMADDGSRFSKSFIVSAGKEQGVLKGDLAMTSSGVLGRVVEVGKNASRLMLLTDYASRVPVVIGEQQTPAILTGDGSLYPKLISLPENHTVSIGDIVLSSGKVGVYPSGLGIGVIEHIKDGDIKVRLFEQNETPVFVRLVNFGISSVLLKDECQAEVLP